MKENRGYIALVSAIIIASILGIVVFGTSTSVFIARFGQLDSEHEMQSRALAFSCAYEALYAYAEDPSYQPAQHLITIGSLENQIPGSCSIDSVTTSGTTLTIIVHASLFYSYTLLEIEAGTQPLSVISWHEITSIPP